MKTLVLIFLTAVNLIVSANGATLEKRDNGMSVMTTQRCPPVCLMYCEFGNVLNANGCPICQCKPNPNCGPVCAIYCQFGNVMDANGCPTCQCKPNPNCPPVCRYITVNLEMLWMPMDAPPVNVNQIRIAHQFVVYTVNLEMLWMPMVVQPVNATLDPGTWHHCPTLLYKVISAIRCRPRGLVSNAVTAVDMTALRCPPVCRIYCEFGNVLDVNSCPICQCNPNPNCPPVCRIYCQFGNVMDANGCPTCKCNPRPRNLASLSDTFQDGRSGLDSNAFTAVDTTVRSRCSPVKCLIYCEYGNVVDANGCSTCSCKDYPDSASRGMLKKK
ncbi:unnamed protein product [Gordionus sp. m RMFG-2023]